MKVTIQLVNIPVAVSRQRRTTAMYEGHSYIGRHRCCGKSAKENDEHMRRLRLYIGRNSCRGKSTKVTDLPVTVHVLLLNATHII